MEFVSGIIAVYLDMCFFFFFFFFTGVIDNKHQVDIPTHMLRG